MKVLWFTITPCGASEKLMPELHTAGWLTALEEQIKVNREVDLSVCFYYQADIPFFTYKSVNYYPVKRGRGIDKIGKLIDRVNSFRSGNDAPFIPALLKIIELVNPDIIHIHGIEDNFGLVREYTKVPVVFSIQSLLSPYCERFFAGVPSKAASENESIVSKALMNSWAAQFFLLNRAAKRERQMLREAQFIIGRTSWDRRITRIMAPKSTYFVGNEIMRDLFYASQWNKGSFNKKLKIVTTMSGGLYKGLESVLKVASVLTNYHYEFEWIVIGQSDSDGYARMVERWLKLRFDRNNVVLVGRKSVADVVEILCGADVFCQVSHIENSPNSLCEAMLLGMPIVATFAGGTDSLFENDKDGLLVQDGDSYSIAGAITELSVNFQKSRQYGINAREKALVRHDRERVVAEVIAVYNEIYSSVKI